MADDEGNLWDALNLQPGASVDDVRLAFRELSRIYHPDKHVGSSSSGSTETGAGGERAAFQKVHRAYRILSDDVLRNFYDRYGLPGIRLTESLSDDEGEVQGNGSLGSKNDHALSLPEDRLKDLESRVQRLVQKHEELRSQRLLGLNGSFTLSLAA
ncbi:unnamed protein product, partial [Polarella glacialis]